MRTLAIRTILLGASAVALATPIWGEDLATKIRRELERLNTIQNDAKEALKQNQDSLANPPQPITPRLVEPATIPRSPEDEESENASAALKKLERDLKQQRDEKLDGLIVIERQ